MRMVFATLASCLLLGGSAQAAKKVKSPAAPSKPSGIYGQVLRIGFPPHNPAEDDGPNAGDEIPLAGVAVVVRRLGHELEFRRVVSDKSGKFKLNLPPGKYIVEPLNPAPEEPTALDGSKVEVTVWWGFYSQARAVFDGGW